MYIHVFKNTQPYEICIVLVFRKTKLTTKIVGWRTCTYVYTYFINIKLIVEYVYIFLIARNDKTVKFYVDFLFV